MRALGIAVSLVAFASGNALGQPTPEAEPATPAPPSYAVEILAVDAASMAVAAAVSLSDARLDFSGPPNRLQTFAGSWWLLSTVVTPGVHWAHRRPLGWASLGIRMGMPLLASGIGAFAYCTATIEQDTDGTSSFGDDCEDVGLPAGLIAGTAAAAAIDAWLLARPHPSNTGRRGGTWYGWQTLAIDAAGLGLGIYFASNPDALDNPEEMTEGPETATLNIAVGLYTIGTLGAPWIHVARGRHLRALGSFGMRAVMPALMSLGGVVGWCMGTAGADSGACSETGLEVGFMSGAVLSAVIDGFVLSWDDEPPPAPAGPARPSTGPPGMTWVPGFALEPGGARLTLGAAF